MRTATLNPNLWSEGNRYDAWNVRFASTVRGCEKRYGCVIRFRSNDRRNRQTNRISILSRDIEPAISREKPLNDRRDLDSVSSISHHVSRIPYPPLSSLPSHLFTSSYPVGISNKPSSSGSVAISFVRLWISITYGAAFGPTSMFIVASSGNPSIL